MQAVVWLRGGDEHADTLSLETKDWNSNHTVDS
jgi:hypothetical protein